MSIVRIRTIRRGAGTRPVAIAPKAEQDALVVALHEDDKAQGFLPTQVKARKILPPDTLVPVDTLDAKFALWQESFHAFNLDGFACSNLDCGECWENEFTQVSTTSTPSSTVS